VWEESQGSKGSEKLKQGYVADSTRCREEIVGQRDSLISMHCRKGNTTIIENYCPFTNYYKWYVYINETKFVWMKKIKSVNFLVRMMQKLGLSHKEVKLEKNGDVGQCCIFQICSMNETLDAKSDLVEFWFVNLIL